MAMNRDEIGRFRSPARGLSFLKYISLGGVVLVSVIAAIFAGIIWIVWHFNSQSEARRQAYIQKAKDAGGEVYTIKSDEKMKFPVEHNLFFDETMGTGLIWLKLMKSNGVGVPPDWESVRLNIDSDYGDIDLHLKINIPIIMHVLEYHSDSVTYTLSSEKIEKE